MIKKGIVFVIFLMFSIGLFGAEKKKNPIFGISFDIRMGMINGSIGEYVFDDNCKNTDNMVSRLDWDVITVPFGEIEVDVDLFKYLYIGASGRLGFPVYSGVLQDYDWLNSVPPMGFHQWSDEDPTELTNYSKHSNKIEKYYNFSVRVGGNIPINDNFIITPYVGFAYDFIEMAASDGYTKYKWNDFQEIPLNKGKIISYAQEINQFILGAKIDFSGIPRLPIYFDFNVVPGLGKLGALDIHFGRPYSGGEATAFLDIISPIFLFYGRFSSFYEFNRYNLLGFSTFVNYMPLMRGMNGVGPVKNGRLPDVFKGNSSGQGGASRFLFGISFVYKICF